MRLLSSRQTRHGALALLTSTMLCTTGAALAQGTTPTPEEQAAAANAAAADAAADDGDIVVTAQKRSENLQDVPIAITAFGTERLDDLQINDFDDFARYIPSISIQSAGPGFSNTYFRGVASGENANHSASLPSVGTYLDEQPIATITGALDLHVFDIARVEALAGPQGTLYGASSQAGTIRIITNKPDTSGFYGETNLEVNNVAHGGFGYTGEAFVNMPISSGAAFRIVGWYRKDAGYIDNIPGTFVFPSMEAVQGTAAATFTNAPFVEDDYNDVETYGARAALSIDLNDSWTVTPQLMGQHQVSHGTFAQESGLDELQVQQFNPERFRDKWFQAALTVEGKIGNLDLTYAGAYMRRQIDGSSDYVDYGYFYDALAAYGYYWYDNNGDLVYPNQYIISDDSFTKMSHELRLASPSDKRVRLIGGLFYQRQTHNIEQNYIIDNITDLFTVTGTESNIWLTKQYRVDRDYAIFGEATADITRNLTMTLGSRMYRYNNSLVGFFGFASAYGGTGERACFGPPVVQGSPCTDLGELVNGEVRPKKTSDTDFIHRINVTYKFGEDALVYGTVSRGFRPGGINRRGTLPPYGADFIDNYELGFKTSWANNRLRVNGSIYQLDWTGIQLSFLGQNGLTEIRNAGNARIRGAELDIFARIVPGLTLSAGAAFNDAEITRDFCLIANQQFDCTIPAANGTPNDLLAPAGTRLPLTARIKANMIGRWEFPIGSNEGHIQVGVVHEGHRTSDLRLVERGILGDLDAYTLVDITTGIKAGKWKAELFVKNLFDVNGTVGNGIQCVETTCGTDLRPLGFAIGPKIYTFVVQPRTIGVRVGTKF